MRGSFYIGICAVALLTVLGCNRNNSATPQGLAVQSVDVQDLAVVMPNPDEPWTKLQIEYMQTAAKEVGCTLHVIPVDGTTNSAVKLAVGNASASRATGLLIQSPTEDSGTLIRDDTETFGIPTVAINTRLRDPETKKYLDLAFHGIDNRDLGSFASTEALAEATKRGWKVGETGVIIFTQPDGGKFSIRGQAMKDAVSAAGYSPAQTKILRWTSAADAESQAAAAMGGAFKNWIIVGGADAPVLAAVRASEAKSVAATNVIGVSIGGLGALDELQKPATGFFASLLLGPKAQGYDVLMRLVKAIKSSVKVDPMPDYDNGVLLTRDTLQKEMKDQMLDKLPDYAKSIQP